MAVGWAAVATDNEPEPDVASLRPGRALAMAAVVAIALALAIGPATAPVTLQSLHLDYLTSGLAGLAAVLGGAKFLAMAGGVTARFLARPPTAVAISPGE